jgi:alkanesulfonate monooxygenase SsuD/methylene tetrahydromethanopterin reductase-like flavin-dependent oxidoreductase (luciferase family)
MPDLLFGLDIPARTALGDPVAQARTAETLGFDFVSTADHPGGDQPTYETWTMLSWMAAGTQRIRVASRVLGVPYRPPAVVAKMAETLDRLSGGRLILGLGGGYSDDEFRALGLRVPSPRDKVDGLGEAIQITRGLWTQPRFTFDGRLYHTDAADIEPKPEHAIPIWLGTFGDRALTLTGRLADGWIPSLGLATPDRIPAMRGRIFAGADAAGRPAEAITCVYNLGIRVDEKAAPADGAVIGSPDAVSEQLIGFTRLGFTAFNFQPAGPDRAEQIERLAKEVVPVVRAAI